MIHPCDSPLLHDPSATAVNKRGADLSPNGRTVSTKTGLPTEPENKNRMELDTEELEIRLPQEKLIRLKTVLSSWRGKKVCRKRELLSLIGLLSHAYKAVRAGRSFLRRLIDSSTSVKHLDRWVQLNRSARSDIEWWYQYCARWNGTAMMSVVNKASSEFEISMVSDASGTWGCSRFATH